MINLVEVLNNSGVAVIPTDTIYGIVADALDEEAVNKVYSLKKRNPKKPFIILISKLEDLELFSVKVSLKEREILERVWPGEVSVVLECGDENFKYLHRGTKTLAFRLPQNKSLLEILKSVGPLIAPSANPQGLQPAENIDQVKNYFGDSVDFYLDGGEMKGEPSTIIEIKDGKAVILRQGRAIVQA